MLRLSISEVCTLVAVVLLPFAAVADQYGNKLPAILTLSYALSLADEPHPSLLLNQADIQQAEALQRGVDAADDMSVRLEAQLQYVEPSKVSMDQSNDDNRIGLIVNKSLYDFGLQNARSQSAQDRVSGAQYAYLDARAKRRMVISQRYFDVLLADLVFLRQNEEMAVEYILLDRLKSRKELGTSTDLAIAEQEQHYQRARFERTNSQNQQRRTRALLAEALNRPGQLSSELAEPELTMLARKLPEYEELLTQAIDNNYHLKSLRASVAAAEKNVAASRAMDNPKLTGHVEAYNYSRELGSSDELRVGVVLDVPLYTGERSDAHIAEANAGLYRARSNMLMALANLRQAILDTWLELDALRIKRDEVAAIRDYRELDLDRRRALYEMEVKTDLGRGMALISEAQFLVKQTDFNMALAWIKMDILTGQLKLTSDKDKTSVPK